MLDLTESSVQDRLFVYLNPGFTGAHGYYCNHAAKILASLRKSETPFLHLVNQETDDEHLRTFSGIRTFYHRPHLTIGRDPVQQEALLNEFREVFSRLLESGIRDRFRECVFYLYSGHPIYVTAIAEALGRAPSAQNEISIYVNFLYNEKQLVQREHTPELSGMFRRTTEALAAHDRNGTIKMFVDCPFAVDLYRDILPRAVGVLPAACSIRSNRGLAGAIAERLPATRFRPLRVGYIGYPHQKYGYELVYTLYQNARREQWPYDFNIRHQTVHAQQRLKQIQEDWLQHNERISHWVGFIDEKQYLDLLNSVDLVIIPYDSGDYPVQTSGVFIEAMSLGKVIVATDGTWFGNVVKRSGVGDVFANGDAASLQVAFQRVVADFPRYRRQARIHGRRYRRYWSADNLLAHLGLTSQKTRLTLLNNEY